MMYGPNWESLLFPLGEYRPKVVVTCVQHHQHIVSLPLVHFLPAHSLQHRTQLYVSERDAVSKPSITATKCNGHIVYGVPPCSKDGTCSGPDGAVTALAYQQNPPTLYLAGQFKSIFTFPVCRTLSLFRSSFSRSVPQDFIPAFGLGTFH